MKYADACVHPYPDGDSSICRCALEAKELGLDAIVSTGGGCTDISGITVVRGAVLSGSTARDISRGLKKCGGSAGLVSVLAGNAKFNRAVIGLSGIHIMRGIPGVPRNAFDHVAARFAAERGIAIDISLHPLIHMRGLGRQKILDRYADLLRLHRRYEFAFTISSDARSFLDLRSVREMVNLCSLFGMEEDEVHRALGTTGCLLSPPQYVEVIE